MDTFLLILRLVVALATVLALMWAAAKLFSRSALGQGSRSGNLQVVSRTALTRTASVALVQLGDEAILLGVTDQQVNVLHRGDATTMIRPIDLTTVEAAVEKSATQRISATPGATPGARILEHLRTRTERR